MRARLRNHVSAALTRIDNAADQAVSAGLSWLIWPVFYAITSGAGVWMLTHRDKIAQAATNKLGADVAAQMARWVGATAAVLVLVYVGSVVVAKLRSGTWRGLETVGELNRRLRFLLALPFIPALSLTKIEVDKPELTYLFAALCAGIIGWAVYGWTHPPHAEPADDLGPEPPASKKLGARAAAGAAVAALWAGYGLFFSRLSITNHHALNTRAIDLGYYDNIFYQSVHGKPLSCTLIRGGWHGSAHFDPLLVILSPLYLLYPRAEMLLVLQAIWVGSGVVPLYLIARDKLGKRLPSVVVAALYALYPALHGATMYEFHSLTLLSPLILWVLYFLERGWLRAYALMLIPTLLLREDVPLLLCFVGLYAIVSRRPGYARVGWLTILVSAIYFVVVKRYIMPSPGIFMTGKDAHSYAYYYEDLIPNKNGVGGLIVSVISNPAFVLKHIFAEAKVRYFLTLFLPLAFLPFFARKGRVMLAYGMLFCFLASRTAVFSPAFQYSSTIIPIAFALVPMALQQLEDGRLPSALGLDARRMSRAALGIAFAASLLLSWKFGGFVANEAFRGGFSRVTRKLSPDQEQTYAWLKEQVDSLPMAASVGVTNKLGPHASNRKDVYFYPGQGTVRDWLLLDEGELKEADRNKHQQRVQKGDYRLVSRHKSTKFALYQRNPNAKPEPAAPATTAAPAAPGATGAPVVPGATATAAPVTKPRIPKPNEKPTEEKPDEEGPEEPPGGE
ncbi:DUF2079 domain-containing protein [Chondromyces apiculatus]|uniref:DUF2079 domain-containing protein n=1 Tax=Chondromyces apiculatus DSM 436 TaxID=1192034 RepID=A0A017SYR3_9BACT|nr:DUF2079 domain-containing protein [Chondromyces apiculatus]EYF02109.1 Hypothetical protein CAP_7449 [Chondromyces apiculatus DSM 436]